MIALLWLQPVLCISAYAAVAKSPLSTLQRRQNAASTNDVTCSQENYKNQQQQPPPTVIKYADGSSACGCASDIIVGGNTTFQECNTVYPYFGSSDYKDSGLRQNRCYLDDNQVATCGTSCTPNTSLKNDGTDNCQPTNPSSYSLQSPTTEFGSATSISGFTGSVIEYTEPTEYSSVPASPSPSSDGSDTEQGAAVSNDTVTTSKGTVVVTSNVASIASSSSSTSGSTTNGPTTSTSLRAAQSSPSPSHSSSSTGLLLLPSSAMLGLALALTLVNLV